MSKRNREMGNGALTYDDFTELLPSNRTLYLAISKHLNDLVGDLGLQGHLNHGDRIWVRAVTRSEVVDGDGRIPVQQNDLMMSQHRYTYIRGHFDVAVLVALVSNWVCQPTPVILRIGDCMLEILNGVRAGWDNFVRYTISRAHLKVAGLLDGTNAAQDASKTR